MEDIGQPGADADTLADFLAHGEHFAVEEVDIILSTTEQIARLAAIECNVSLTEVGQAAINKAIAASVELLEIQMNERRPKVPAKTTPTTPFKVV